MGVLHIGWDDFTHDFGIVCPMGELRNRGSTCQILIFMINMLPFRGYNRCGSTFFQTPEADDHPCGSADRSWMGLRDPSIDSGGNVITSYNMLLL